MRFDLFILCAVLNVVFGGALCDYKHNCYECQQDKECVWEPKENYPKEGQCHSKDLLPNLPPSHCPTPMTCKDCIDESNKYIYYPERNICEAIRGGIPSAAFQIFCTEAELKDPPQDCQLTSGCQECWKMDGCFWSPSKGNEKGGKCRPRKEFRHGARFPGDPQCQATLSCADCVDRDHVFCEIKIGEHTVTSCELLEGFIENSWKVWKDCSLYKGQSVEVAQFIIPLLLTMLVLNIH